MAKQILADMPLARASIAGVPPLDPSDLIHVPRWLASLAEAEAYAAYSLSTYDESAHRWVRSRTLREALAYPDHARWGDGR